MGGKIVIMKNFATYKRYLKHSAVALGIFLLSFLYTPAWAITISDLLNELGQLETRAQTLQSNILKAENDPQTTTATKTSLLTELTAVRSRTEAIKGLLQTTPSAPAVKAQTGSFCGGNISLAYTAPVQGMVLKYELNRNPDGNQLAQWGIINQTAGTPADIKNLPSNDNGIKPDTIYKYQLRAVGPGDVEAYSDIVQAKSSAACPPATCTYTYSAFGKCQPDSTETRTILSSSPAGCAGTPSLSQSCTYVPPVCSYSYSNYGQCQSNNVQTRTVVSSAPTGCVGTPALSQSCTYVPPVCSSPLTKNETGITCDPKNGVSATSGSVTRSQTKSAYPSCAFATPVTGDNSKYESDTCVYPPTVNGGWTAWNPISCPTACGLSVSTQTRSCTNPLPSNGGVQCAGLATQSCPATATCPPPPATVAPAENGLVTTFSSPGVQQWKVPAGVTKIKVKIWGAGGGGGVGYVSKSNVDTSSFLGIGHSDYSHGASGGGGGGYASASLSVNPDNSFSIIIGKGGTITTPAGRSEIRSSSGSYLGAGGGGGGSPVENYLGDLSRYPSFYGLSGEGAGGDVQGAAGAGAGSSNGSSAGGGSVYGYQITPDAGLAGVWDGAPGNPVHAHKINNYDRYDAGPGGAGGNGGAGGRAGRCTVDMKGSDCNIGDQPGEGPYAEVGKSPGGGGGGSSTGFNYSGIEAHGGNGQVVIEILERGAPQNSEIPVVATTALSCGGKVDLSWTKPAGSGIVSGYIIYRLDYDAYAEYRNPPVYELIIIRDVNITRYTDAAPSVDKKYWYYVFPATAAELAADSGRTANAAAVILAQSQAPARGFSGAQVFQTFGATRGGSTVAEKNFAFSSAACVSNPDLTPAPSTPIVSDGETDASWVDASLTPNVIHFTPGKKAKLDGGVLNLGPGVVPAGKHFNVRFQKSETQTFDATNVGIVDVTAPAGNLLKNGKIPVSYLYPSVANDDGKTYYFRYCVDQPPTDDKGSVLEQQGPNDSSAVPPLGEYNNCSGPIVVKFRKPDKPTCDCSAINSSLVMPQSALVIAANTPNITGTKDIKADDASVIKLRWNSTGADSVTLFKTLPDGKTEGGNLIAGNVVSGEISLTNLTVGVYDYVFTAKNLGGECVSKVHFNIVPTPLPKPDLIISVKPAVVRSTGASGPLYVGERLTFNATVKNQSESPASNIFYNRFQILREDKTIEANVGEPTLPNLAVGGAEVVTSSSWTAVAGTYRVVACADTSDTPALHNKINEGDKEDNNCSPSDSGASGTTIKVEKPDLIPLGAAGATPGSNTPVPSGTTFVKDSVTYYKSGTKVTFTVEPKNIGGAFTTPPPSFNVKLQVKDAVHPDTPAGDAFYIDRGTAAISGGLSYNQSKTATIEEASGATETKAFKYRYCVDLPPNENQTGDPTGLGVIAESNESNNCSSPVIMRYGLPDVPPPTLTLKVRKAEVDPYTHDLLTVGDGDRVDLSWNYTGQSACSASWKTPSAISEVDSDLSVGPLLKVRSPYTYTVTCGGLSDTVKVNVNPPVVDTRPLSCVLNVRPYTATGTFGPSVIIFAGEGVELQWKVTGGATSVSLFKFVLSAKEGDNLVSGNAPNGVVTSNNLSLGHYQYKLSATNATETRGCAVDVEVNSAPKPDLVPLNPPTVTGPSNAEKIFTSGGKITLYARAENIGGSKANEFKIKFQYKPAGQSDDLYQDFTKPDGSINYATVSGGLGAKIKLTEPVSITHTSRLDERGVYDFRYCVDMPPNDGVGSVNEMQVSDYADSRATPHVGEYNNCSESSMWSFAPPPTPPPVGCSPNCTPPPTVVSSGPLSVTCSVSPNPIDLAKVSSATWTATPSGGTSPYAFEWLAGDSGNSFDGYLLPYSTGQTPTFTVNYVAGDTFAQSGTARGPRSGKVEVNDSSYRMDDAPQDVTLKCGPPGTTSPFVSSGSLQASCAVSATSTDAVSGDKYVTWTVNTKNSGVPPYSYIWKVGTLPEQTTNKNIFKVVADANVTPLNFQQGTVTVSDSTQNKVSQPKTDTADCGTVNIFNSDDDYTLSAGPVATLNFIGETASSNKVPVTVGAGWFDKDIIISASPGTLDGTSVPYLFYAFYKNGALVGSTATLKKNEYATGLEMVVKASKFIPATKYPNAITVHAVAVDGSKPHDVYVSLNTNDSRPTFQNF